MNTVSLSSAGRFSGAVTASEVLGADLRLIDVRTDQETRFLPGQFAMLNFEGDEGLVFGRPLSILAGRDGVWSFLFRVVGRGTRMLARAEIGSRLSILAPLGGAFPPPEPGQSDILIAGGVGLPPLVAWYARYGDASTAAFFGARNGDDVPWKLLSPDWTVGLENPKGAPADRFVATGLVTDVCRAGLGLEDESNGGSPAQPRRVLACGPLPMLLAVVALAADNGWRCLVSLEEHMGCGFGVCRGCVIPRTGGGWLTACSDGPVFEAEQIDWDAFVRKGDADAHA